NGLQMTITKCSVAWTESGSSPAYTYTCGGSTSTVLASTPVTVTSAALSNLTLTVGASNHLRVTLTLPGASTNMTMRLSMTITYHLTGYARAGTNKRTAPSPRS